MADLTSLYEVAPGGRPHPDDALIPPEYGGGRAADRIRAEMLRVYVPSISLHDLRRLAGSAEIFLAKVRARISYLEDRERQHAPAPAPAPEPDEPLDVHQAAKLTGRSAHWLWRHKDRVPGFQQPRGKGTSARWSRRALEDWLKGAPH